MMAVLSTEQLEARVAGLAARVVLQHRQLQALEERLDFLEGRLCVLRCRGGHVKGTEVCRGNDVCIYGPGGAPDWACVGFGRFCCRCGASYAEGQL